MTRLPFRIASRAPLIATGTIGACPFIAMMKPPFLNGKQLAGPAARPFGKDQERVALAQRLRGPLDRRQALVAVAALERDEPGEIERAHEDRQLAQLRLVEDAQPREELAAAPSKRIGGSTLLAWLTA